MKRLLPVAALALSALAIGACDKPRTNSAYNNSGQSATPLMPAAPPAQAAAPAPEATAAPAPQPATSSTATSDTTSPAVPPVEPKAAK